MNCHASGNWCQGYSTMSTTTGGVASSRCFSLRTTNAAPTCALGGVTASNEATWEMNAGACLTFYYFEGTNGAVPPATPNKMTINVRFDNTGTVVRTYQTSPTAPPVTGTSYSFCSTSDGTVTGALRAGTYRLYVRAIKDNGAGGVGNYDIDSDGTATVGVNIANDKGAIRGKLFVASVSPSAYPSGSTFAYGSAGDESATITATFTQPIADNNVETVFDSILDSGTLLIGQAGATVDVDAVTTLAQAFVIDQTFPLANAPYVPGFTIAGNSALTSLKWTILASTGHGAGLTRVSDTFIYGSTFNIDPNIKMDSDGAGGYGAADGTDKSYVTTCTGGLVELFNRGETVCQEWYLYNSRGELLSRAMSFARRDSGNQCSSYGSLSPTANKYTQTEALPNGGACAAAADTTGTPRFLRVTNTDQTYDSGTVMSVSSLLRFDADGSGAPDNDVAVCLNACPATETTLFNRGEAVDCEGYLINARGTQYQQTGVQWRAEASDATQTNSQAINHVAGKYSCNAFTLTSGEKATADTTGDPHKWTATKDGNTATSDANRFAVSSLYFVDSHLQISGTLAPDDYPTDDAAEDLAYEIRSDGSGGDASDVIHHWCKVEGVRHDVNIDTSGSAVTRNIIDPLIVTRAAGTTDTGADGWTPTSQNLLASTPLGDDWTALCSVSFGGNTGTDTETFETLIADAGTGETVYTGADPLTVFGGAYVFNQTIPVAVHSRLLDGSARLGVASEIFVSVYEWPAMTSVVTGGSVVELDATNAPGAYVYAFTPPAIGSYLIAANTTDGATAIGAHNVITLTASASGTDSNDTLALLLDKLGPQGEPVNIESSTLDFWVPVVLWLVALLFFLKLGKLLAAGAATAGLGLALATDANLGWAALALIILVLALWLEATLMEGIYQRWFGGRVGRRTPE